MMRVLRVLRGRVGAARVVINHALLGAALLLVLIPMAVMAIWTRLFGVGQYGRDGLHALLWHVAHGRHAWSARVLGRQAEQTRGVLPWVLAFGATTVLSLGTMAALLLGMFFFISVVTDVGDGLGITPLLFAVLLAVIAWLLLPWLVRLQAHLTDWLLSPSPLAKRVAELAETRAHTVDAQATELRRIERDLHDGAQARLVTLRMTLGMAQQCGDLATMRSLVGEAHECAGHALDELRDLVRGIHPPVLAERGLAGGIRAAALSCPVPVDVRIDLTTRPEPPIESAVYFALTEILTNIAKHSGARAATIHLTGQDGMIRLSVTDDGRGGATPVPGAGLHGIGRRLAAFDGSLAIDSPAGGPSEFTMEVPCALSSQKT